MNTPEPSSSQSLTSSFTEPSSASTQESSSVSESQQNPSSSLDDDISVVGPEHKKVKVGKEAPVELRVSAFVAKVIAVANTVWESTACVERINKSHVSAKFDEKKGLITAKVKCLLCTEEIVVYATKYDATSMTSYKRHVTVKHVTKAIDAKQNQPTVAAAFKNMIDKKNKTAALDGSSVDLTSNEASVATNNGDNSVEGD